MATVRVGLCVLTVWLLGSCGRNAAVDAADSAADASADVDAQDGFGPCPAGKPTAGSPCSNEPWCLYDWRCAPCCGYTTLFMCQNGKWVGPGIEELPPCDVGPSAKDAADVADPEPDSADIHAAADDGDVALPDAVTPGCALYEDHGGCYVPTPMCAVDSDCNSGHCGTNGHCDQWVTCGCTADADCANPGQPSGQKRFCITNNTACGMCVVAKLCATSAECAKGAYCTSDGYCQTQCCL